MAHPWQTLFGDAGAPGSIPVRIVRKGGHPFLILPQDARAAARAVELYPAQRPFARAARAALRAALARGFPVPLERSALPLDEEDPFARFVAGLSGSADGDAPRTFPLLGILIGNPNAAGQRFIVLVLDEKREPCAVVKAGVGARAKELIDAEARFLAAAPRDAIGITRLRGTFHSARLHALALDYVAGVSPREAEPAANIAPLLKSWLDGGREVAVSNLPVWERLQAACGTDPDFAAISRAIGACKVRPAICHGDFVPWNVRVTHDGSWSVFDWERGELAGLPGWDWFHYVIQTGVLVRRLPVRAILSRIEALLASAEFRDYAAAAGVGEIARELVFAHLLHGVHVLPQTEGLETVKALLELMRAELRRSAQAA